jgi:hypothetical protein
MKGPASNIAPQTGKAQPRNPYFQMKAAFPFLFMESQDARFSSSDSFFLPK